MGRESWSHDKTFVNEETYNRHALSHYLRHFHAPHHRPPSFNMSLSLSYSSDEEISASVTKDIFGLTDFPVAKKHRVENATTITTDAAPDVLAEVPTLPR